MAEVHADRRAFGVQRDSGQQRQQVPAVAEGAGGKLIDQHIAGQRREQEIDAVKERLAGTSEIADRLRGLVQELREIQTALNRAEASL